MIKSALILDLFFKQLFFNNIFKNNNNNICLKILIIFIKKISCSCGLTPEGLSLSVGL